MIGRILCFFRIHKWYTHTFRYAQWDECDRCEKVKQERVPRTFTREEEIRKR